MSTQEFSFEELVPIELKLRLLRAELERLESDAEWLNRRRLELREEIRSFEERLFRARQMKRLRRVK